MKIKGSIDISKSRNEVVKYFVDPKYLGEYQDGFVRKELISGAQNKQGSVSKVYYRSRKQNIILTETITNNQLPDLYEASYYHVHMDNTMQCKFIELNDTKTRYEYEYIYTRINWVMPKLMAILFPGMYKKPIEKWMKQFKEFVEAQ